MVRLVPARLLFVFALLVCCAVGPARAQLFETRAQQAYLIDADTGTVLFAKNENDLVPPASLAKLMTMEVVFHAIRSGRLTLEDTFEVSENAWRTGGAMSRTSTMFAELKSSIRLEDLIQGVIVQSANDGCIIIAEGMAGSEENFARLMTERAREIGLTQSVFGNSNGLPHPDSKVSMKDLVTLARHIQSTYPEFYRYYSQRDFTWNKILQRNRNPLLGLDIGVDGMKTGFTEESGYAIVASINRDGRRLFLAMGGMSSERERAEESRKMLEWGIRAFERKTLFAQDETIGELSVYGGAGSAIVRAKGAVDIFIPITNPERLAARITYGWPLRAPLEAGAQVGVLKVYIGDTLSQETPLYVVDSVDKGPLYSQALDALLELAQFWL
ncbi:MAG: D-alanyl-D-alanine carboxypeptidase [Hoeflea sp.]|uniref:D-alanyl-D-alanine carboxypeptidase family protein n=1 Tax=Hoeflea sp. TaxID=1940281 RepID=UPI001DEEAAD9|nr:D-alanyl-D-alanine carboxypeptidase family protein [Hoeflea sp.]MBU4529500.1 D-alanyl-D-alanine carboxypeptidase [Alphaproteobacteria bacterium]MBU4546619.1 D-alanyl-D-alanine carboxypeptidase [Alphaproteobacteria bacterium]MBU4550887.1 D-alanyl-D-alanine carboxypeptidase [Alphaproteobacteria bacterium]MBV1723829.1 D-alanyl-D-alanine carboxypeptidase [Hoeflea sp.]MBV1763106.1 D-alanyl-D-alanine carboxypeptidase [Hoeflea sp.]